MSIQELATKRALEQLSTSRTKKEIEILKEIELIKVEAHQSGHAKATFIFRGKTDICTVGGGFDFFNYYKAERDDIKKQAEENIKLECIRTMYNQFLKD